MKGRCKCCGSKEHKLLKISTNEHGQLISEFSCPVVDNGGIDAHKQITQNYLRYRPKAQLLAEQHAYNLPLIETALLDFEDHGTGGYLPPYQLRLFRNQVMEICEQVRSLWTFKRTVANTESSDDEDNQAL